MSLEQLDITDVVIRLNRGRPGPFAKINGRWHCISTRPSMLAMGLAMVVPMNEIGDVLEEDWDTQPRFCASVSADPSAGRPDPMEFADATDDPRVVAYARRYEEVARQGQLREGPLAL